MAGHEGPSSADADDLRHQGEKVIQFACALGFDAVDEASDSEEEITTQAAPAAPTRRKRRLEARTASNKRPRRLGSEEEEEEEEEWAPTAFSTASAFSTPNTSYVADLPRRPGHVAVRSASAQGKGDVVLVVQQAHYDEAVDLFRSRPDLDWPATTNGEESEPRMGVLARENPAPSGFQHATREDAIRSLLETEQPYGDELHKFLALATLLRLETQQAQERVHVAFPEAQRPEHARYFEDEQGNALPKVGIRVVHDSGEGENVDYGSGSLEWDRLALLTFGGGTIGGAQNGARRTVLVGSEEDMRLNTPAVAATTVTERTMAVRLYDVVVLVARSNSLYEIGPWLSENVVGIAKVPRREGVSLVETKKGKGYYGKIWVYLDTQSDNFDLCWPGPGFVVFVTQQFCFSGYKNLARHDKEGAKRMEVGRSGDFSTPATKARTATVGGVKVTVPEGVWVGDEPATPLQQAAMDQRSENSARGARTATVDGVKVLVPKAVMEGSEAPTRLQQRAMDQLSEDSARGGQIGGAAQSGEQENPNPNPRGPGGAGVKEFDYDPYRRSIGFHYRGYKENGKLVMSGNTFEFFEYSIGNMENGAWILGTHQFSGKGRRLSSYPYRKNGTRLQTDAKVGRIDSYLRSLARDHGKEQG